MHFDALALACVAAQLNDELHPGRIQQVLLVDDHSIGLEIYTPGTRHQMLIALNPNASRVHVVSYKLRRGVDGETPFLLLLRKYARGALLAAVEQPDSTERILRLHLEHAEVGATVLIVELIGRQPNALLVNPAGRILDCLHRMPPTAGGRASLPGHPYVAPEPPAKLPPIDDGAEEYYARLAAVTGQPGPLWKALVAGIAGMSPTAAREIAWRVQGSADAPADGAQVLAVAHALQELWAPVHTGGWQPGVVEEDGRVVGFAPYPIHFRGQFVEQPSISAALERYYAQAAAVRTVDAYAALRGQVTAQLTRAYAQNDRRLAALAGDEPAPGEVERLRTQANWLLALGGEVQAGQTLLEVDTGAELLSIALDPQWSPVEQAQRMFKRAAKLARAAAIIPQRRAELLADRELLDQLALDVQRAGTQPELGAVVDELRRAGYVRSLPSRAPRPHAPEGGPLRFKTPRGAEIVVGRNARQNEVVTFKLARPDDRWLHVRGAPGAHVILRGAGQGVDERDVRAAAQLAAYHSSMRGELKVDVMVTARRWVSRAPGGRTGQVIVAREQVLTVPAEEPADVQRIGS